jgi:hypothetical protein
MGDGAIRNLFCECGSGKKYKRCCQEKYNNSSQGILKEHLDAVYSQIMSEKLGRRERLRGIGIFVDFVKPIIFQDRKVWALGSRVYYERPEKETFHEFLLFILIHQVLGEEWWTHQASLPENQWHHIYRSFKKYQEWAFKNQQEENKEGVVWAALPDGWSRSLISLAFDVASLVHTDHLPDDLLHRLKSYDEYQSARYEISIASIFARLGYRIEFLNEKNIKEKHCEFFAHDKDTGEVIAVEVKSRKREGVLHVDGVYNGEYWAHIQRAYRKAQKQNPGDRPFIVFFDINAPQVPDASPLEKPWVREVKALHDKIPLNTPQNPDEISGLVFTNYSFHYQKENQATSGEHLLTIPMHPVFPVKKLEFWNNLQVALSSYGNVPNLDIEYGQ